MFTTRSVLILLVCNCVVNAGEAVSNINGKLDFASGSMESAYGQKATGSFGLPVSDHIGVQVDGLYTNVTNRDFYGAGGHLFWRDSDKGLVGITAGVIDEKTIHNYHAGLEAEYYHKNFTLGSRGGIARIKYDSGYVPFIDTDETDLYADAELKFYPLKDLMLSCSYAHTFDNGYIQGQVEYLTPFHGISLFAEAVTGDHDYDHALFGIRFYFGKDKSLIRRHREDDPQAIPTRMLYGIGTYGAEYNKKQREYSEAHDIPYTGGSYGVYVINFTNKPSP